MAKKSSYSPFLHLCLALLLIPSYSSSRSTLQPTAGEQHALRTIVRDWGNPAGLRSWSAGNWTGVTCNSHGLVTSINAKGFNIANPIPSSLCSLKNLSSIDLSSNNLTGHFPTVLYGCSALLHLDLSNNRFTGSLPSDIHSLSSRMQHLNLSRNGFTGGIGPVLAAINLIELDLSINRLSGPIPKTIRNMKNLALLFLCCNNIAGPIPAMVGSLPALNVLDLSNNKLSGHIPQELGNLRLSFLNLSSNKLTGEVPQSMQTPAYNRSFLGNRGLCMAVKQGMSLPSCALPGYSMQSTGLIILCAVLTGVVVIGAFIICCTIIRHLREEHVLGAWKMTPFDDLKFTQCDVLAKLHEDNLVGSGGSGNVYRVQLPGEGGTGQVVAVKKILTTESDVKLDKQFDSEVKILGNIQHNNIVSLLCCISGKNMKMLVYEYMENGSLDHWLHRPEDALAPAPLDWPVRLSIAIDVARGLNHMHHECIPPILHRDIKSSNILLDGGCHAKMGDFGLARALQSCKTEVASVICGTYGYIAPEQYWGRVNDKVDVYSFGVVLLELTTGRVARDRTEFILADWASNQYKTGEPLYNAIDISIKAGPFLDNIVDVFELGVFCTNKEPNSRPSMKIVLEQLLQYDRTQTPE